jgi:hypothetical protein
MAAYRLYRFDRSGHIHTSEVVEAADDAAAIRLASEMLADGSGELWLEQRMIRRLGKSLHNATP